MYFLKEICITLYASKTHVKVWTKGSAPVMHDIQSSTKYYLRELGIIYENWRTGDSCLIANLFGPVEGKRHDSGMLADSGLLNQFQQHSFDTGGRPLCIYADPAYPLRVHLQSGFRGANITREEELWNAKLGSVRQAVIL